MSRLNSPPKGISLVINLYLCLGLLGTSSIFEITLSNLIHDGKVNEQDFLDRAKLLCSMGKTVMITNFQEYYRLSEYFNKCAKHLEDVEIINEAINAKKISTNARIIPVIPFGASK